MLLHFLLPAQQVCKNVNAVRVTQSPVIDGKLDEATWNEASGASEFIQNTPVPGKNAQQKTVVMICYDDDAIYVGARMYDSSPDSIMKLLSPRDRYDDNADFFAIFLDTYHDRRNAFLFAVTAAGVQGDARYTFDETDETLNSVWYSKVSLDSSGWSVEMKIPYSAVRFPNGANQVWGVNFERGIRRYREYDYWNNVDPATQGVINQCGDLSGLNDIHSPVRLALFPYVSGYAEHYNGSTAYSLNGGLDVKYGLSKGFTLDMTLVPDFGQTQSDNLVLNLSPFEVKFDERRYFFTEGTDLFNKNDLFYSRRIGARPSGYDAANASLDTNEVVKDNPTVTSLYNAIKISGRTTDKIGLGFLNSVTAPEYATIEDTLTGVTRKYLTERMSNYNVMVIDKILPHNSYIGFLNTNVMREGAGVAANVSSVQFKASTANNKFGLEGYTDMSNVRNAENFKTGYRYSITGGKISGNYLVNGRFSAITPNFNPNDLGYLARNNGVEFGLQQKYNFYKPFRSFVWQFNTVDLAWDMLYSPFARTFFTITGQHIFTQRNYLTWGISWLANPIRSHDYYETRVPGRYLVYPRNYSLGGFISSDYRKKIALDAKMSYRIFLERNRTIFNYSIGPRFRISDKLFIVYSFADELKHDNVGYVNYRNDSLFFGVRNLKTVTHSVTSSYIFNNKMSLNLVVRHYWSEAHYTHYFLLNDAGKSEEAYYNGNADVSFNAFNIDLTYTWQFLPGSELSVVWKNAILSSGTVLRDDYISDAQYIFDSPASNSVSVKLIWYIDAGHLISSRTKSS
ncbi:MAG TPA: DUF5916 domain-containing protein [Bacteroidia bacterium]|nr:DUF5916 domain-containing protein [Bacteroidia bacterium]